MEANPNCRQMTGPKDGPKEDGPKEDGPKEDGPKEDGPKDGPKEDGPKDGPKAGIPLAPHVIGIVWMESIRARRVSVTARME